MNIFKSLFSGNKSEDPKKEENKNFNILKYDGIRAMHIGKTKYAIRCFEEAVAIKDDTETLSLLAKAYSVDEDFNKAISTYEHLLSTTPNDTNNYLSFASILYMQEKYEYMNEICNKAIAIDDKNATLYYLSSKAYIGQKNDIMAIAMLTKAITLKEDYEEALLSRAETLKRMGQLNDGMKDIETILGQNPDNENALLLKGEILISQKNNPEAIETLKIVLELNPFNENAYLLLGGLYETDKNIESALRIYNEAIDINPTFIKAYKERGRIKLINGDKNGSVEDMKKVMELSPKESEKIDGEYNNYDNITKNVPW